MSGEGPVRVVVVHGSSAQIATMWTTCRRLRGRGVRITAFFPGPVPPGRPKHVAGVQIAASPRPSLRHPRAWLRWRPIGRQLAQMGSVKEADPLWQVAAGDLRLLTAVQSADVIVAADRGAVPTVWHLMAQNPDADVVLGYGEARRRIQARRQA